MRCTEFELIYQDLGSAMPPAAAQHAKQCAACGGLAADLNSISAAARGLAIAPEEAPARVWSNLRAQLRAEGIIREPAKSGWEAVWAWIRQPAVIGAYAATALLAVSLIAHPSSGTTASDDAVESASATTDTFRSQQQLDAMEQAFSKTVAGSNSEVDATLRKNLRVVDKFIAECEKAVRQEPHNEAARQYLYGAYQQKAELLNTAMEHSFTGE